MLSVVSTKFIRPNRPMTQPIKVRVSREELNNWLPMAYLGGIPDFITLEGEVDWCAECTYKTTGRCQCLTDACPCHVPTKEGECPKNCPDFGGMEALHKETCTCPCHRPESGIKIVPSGRIDYCCECNAEHGYDCPKDAPKEGECEPCDAPNCRVVHCPRGSKCPDCHRPESGKGGSGDDERPSPLEATGGQGNFSTIKEVGPRWNYKHACCGLCKHLSAPPFSCYTKCECHQEPAVPEPLDYFRWYKTEKDWLQALENKLNETLAYLRSKHQ